MTPKTDLYFCTTPYHIILCSLVASESDTRSELVVYPSFQDPAKIIGAFVEADGNPFHDVHVLPRTLPGERSRIPFRIRQRFYRSLSVLECRRIVAKTPINDVYVANDKKPAAQYLLEQHSTNRFYIEDGTEAYMSSQPTGTSLRDRMRNLEKILYGFWWSPNIAQGTYCEYDAIRATYPSRLADRFERFDKRAIPLGSGRQFITNWAEQSVKRFEQTDPAIEVLFILPYSNFLESKADFYVTINEMIREQLSKNKVVGVKYHPRESNELVFSMNDVDILPPSIPSELLYLLLDDLQTVIGYPSTALTSARWISKADSVVVITAGTDIMDSNVDTLFNAIDIKPA